MLLDGKKEEIETNLKKTFETLKPRNAEILKHRMGLFGESLKTLEETGKLFNITRERVRQIECKTIRQLKHPERKEKIKKSVYQAFEDWQRCVN